MKLSKTQLEVLAKTIKNTANIKIHEYNDKVTSEENFNKWLDEYMKTPAYKVAVNFFDTFVHGKGSLTIYDSSGNMNASNKLEFFKQVFYKEVYPSLKSSVYYQNTYDDLILESIPTESIKDVQELINKMVAKYV